MIEYRQAEGSDAEAVALLHVSSWRANYRGSFTDAFLDGEQPEERLGVWRERLRQPARDQLVLLAVDGPNLMGFVCAYTNHDPEWGSFIDNLHVSSTSKRKGIGATLMRRTGAWFAECQAELGVYLWVLEANEPARRFYERLGATDEGVIEMETHGRVRVRSCRYTWESPRALTSA